MLYYQQRRTGKLQNICIMYVHFMYGVTGEAQLFSVEIIRENFKKLAPLPLIFRIVNFVVYIVP